MDADASLVEELSDRLVAVFLECEATNICQDVNERNLCGRMAVHLSYLLPEYGLDSYYADTEYNRKQGGRIKTIMNEKLETITINCDLILHSRGSSMIRDNLIAVEMKKSTRPGREKDKDRKRLCAMTLPSYDGVWSADGVTHPEHVCGYMLGLFLDLDVVGRACVVEKYQGGELLSQAARPF